MACHKKSKEEKVTNKTRDKKQKWRVRKKKYSSAIKCCTEDKISLLVDMLEANPCLWDVNHIDSTDRGIKEIAYMEIATLLDTRDRDIIGHKYSLNKN